MLYILTRTFDAITDTLSRRSSRAALTALLAIGVAAPILTLDASEASAQVRTMGEAGKGNTARRTTTRDDTRAQPKKTTRTTAKKTTTKKTTRDTTRARRRSTASAGLSSTAYLDLGLGFVTAENSAATDTGVSAGIGMRTGKLGFGANVLGVFDDSPDSAADPNSSSQGLEIGGLSVDARYFFPMGRFEPYGMAGLGYTNIGNDDNEFRPTINLGAGADYRITKEVALGGRYLYNGYWFDDSLATDGTQLPDSASMLMGTVQVRF